MLGGVEPDSCWVYEAGKNLTYVGDMRRGGGGRI